MTIEALGYLTKLLHDLGINYELGEWTSDIVYPYFVGEFHESLSLNEDGKQEILFILNGFNRGSRLELLQVKEKIEKFFQEQRTILPNGNGLVISYSASEFIPTGEDELKRIQINLNINEWKV